MSTLITLIAFIPAILSIIAFSLSTIYVYKLINRNKE